MGGAIKQLASKNLLVAGSNNVTNRITMEELPSFYTKRHILNEIIYPDAIAYDVLLLAKILDK